MKSILMTTALIVVAAPVVAENRIDGQSPDAPSLAAYGDFDVGVREFQFTNPDQINILAIDQTQPKPASYPIYDRPLAVEMWYPSVKGAVGDTTLKAYLRDGVTEVSLEGRAVRDAEAAATGPLPLVLLSHGHPGNRFLMSHLAENIASKGYVVASIDHTDSTYRTVGPTTFGSTLVNRPLDQLFVLDELVKLNQDASSGVAGLIDTDNTGLIGYSMGGYGAVIAAGGGVTEGIVNSGFAPFDTLGIHQQGSAPHDALLDERIKTAVAIGPFGENFGIWGEQGLAGIEIPMLFIAGSDDQTSGYENGVRAIWEGAVNVDRSLLTFDGGSHNTAAPIPAPEESFYFSDALGFNVSEHYTDAVWDTVFMNNVAQHFVTSWLDEALKADDDKNSYLELLEIGSDGVYSLNPDGTFADDHTYWKGFAEGTAAGLRFESLSAQVPLPASVWLFGLAFGGLGLIKSKRKSV